MSINQGQDLKYKIIFFFVLQINSLVNAQCVYKNAIGLYGGLNSGIAVKHFVQDLTTHQNAVEIILGSRWKGFSTTALYEICLQNSEVTPHFYWEVGGGARLGFYNGKNYKDYTGLVRENRTYSMFGIVGFLGMEYFIKDKPITVGINFMPFLSVKNDDDTSYMDMLLSVKYIFNSSKGTVINTLTK